MLINCVVYDEGVRLRDIAVDEIPAWRGQPGRFVWVALRDPDEAELTRMESLFGLHPLAVEDARHGHQRPKIDEYDDMIFGVVRLLEPRDGELSEGEVCVFVGSDYVLSVRTHSEQGFLGVRARCEREPQLLRHGPGFVFYALMDAVVDRYFPVIEALETELEAVEARIFEPGAERRTIRELYRLKQKAGAIRHAVVPLLDAVGKLFGGRVPPVASSIEDYFRDVHDHLVRVSSAVDAVRDTIITAIQVNLAMVTIEQSDVSKRLAAWAAIFAAMTALAGIWGMNFETMPELKWRWGYPAALALMVSIALLLWRRFRRVGWL